MELRTYFFFLRPIVWHVIQNFAKIKLLHLKVSLKGSHIPNYGWYQKSFIWISFPNTLLNKVEPSNFSSEFFGSYQSFQIFGTRKTQKLAIFTKKKKHFYKKNVFFGKNGQKLRFRGRKAKCLKGPITLKILLSWKNACPNFFPVGSREK